MYVICIAEYLSLTTDVGGRKRDNTDAGSYPDEKRPRLAIETRGKAST